MQTRFYLFSWLFFIGVLAANSQPFGNEWIDFSQEYIKIKIAEDGFYRITGSELQQYDFPLSSTPASRVRLFRRGEEISINRVVNQDGVTLSYIEFWAEKNDGDTDTELYISEDLQPHTEYNLFTDTASYFLTWTNSASNKRINTSTDNDNSGLAPEEYHYDRKAVILSSRYNRGRQFGPGNDFSLSEYDMGEGWTGPLRGKNASEQISFELENLTSSSTPIELDVVMIGENSQRHKVRVQVGPDASSLTTIDEPEFEGYNRLYYRTTFDQNLLNGGSTLLVKLTTLGFPGIADNVSYALVDVRYPQSFPLSNENKIYRLKTSAEGRSYLRVPAQNPSAVRFFDVTDPENPIQIAKNELQDRVDLVVPGTSVERALVAIVQPLETAILEKVTFDPIDLTAEYLIITHPFLRNATDGTDPIADYASFRQSSTGGNYKVEVAEIQQIFDQFNYGDPSPLAIKRMLKAGYEDIKMVFIIGRGWIVSTNYYRDSGFRENNPIQIPTYGDPGGDALYSVGLNPQQPQSPTIPIGRLNANSSEEVRGYLDKTIDTENHVYNDLSKKNIIQLSGGQNSQELQVFENFIVDFQNVAEGDFLGGIVMNQGKTTSAVFETFRISEEVNAGVGLITLFGHSSATITDIEIGFVSDDGFKYNNEGKYPVVLVNGCNAGSIFGNTHTLGEDWTLTPKKGAIAFISNSSFASSTTLKRFSDLYYEVSYADENTFGETIGEIISDASDRYFQRWGDSDNSRVQVHQILLQGDPAIRPFGANQPDFSISENDITAIPFIGERVLAQQDSFLLEFPIRNFGKTSPDSISVQVERTYPDGSMGNYSFIIPSPKNEEMVSITLQNDREISAEGNNSFRITIDKDGRFDELNEGNNTGTFQLFIASSNTLNLYPVDKSVVSRQSTSLIFQNADITSDEQGYSLEIDTLSTFTSPFFLRREISGSGLIREDFDHTLPDSTTLFWRTRIGSPQNAGDSIWAESSFTFISNSDRNWGVFNNQQLNTSKFSGLDQNPVNGKIEFTESINTVSIFTSGTEVYQYENLNVQVGEEDLLVTTATFDPFCASNTFNALAFDKETSELFRPIFISGADEFNALVCGRLPQMIYNFTENNILGGNRYLDTFIANLEERDKIVLFNIDSVAYSNWDDQLKSSFELIGVDPSELNDLIDGQPLIIYGEKGMSAGEATILKDDGTSLPMKQKDLELDLEITGNFNSGTIELDPVGPARQWNELSFSFSESGSDSVEVLIELIGTNGESMAYNENARLAEFDISDVDASIYPFIRFTISFNDEDQLTPPQLNYFSLSYEYPPEGLAFPAGNELIEIREGQDILSTFGYANISTSDFTDSINFRYRIQNVESGELHEFTEKIPGPMMQDTSLVDIQIPSLGKVGMHAFFGSFEVSETELYSFNNSLSISEFASVEEDDINPVVDVTVDGRYILDGDIVSARPTIAVTLKDENRILLPRDTNAVILSLKYPEEQNFRKINYSDPTLTFTPASEGQDFELLYQPGSLQDGVYTLQVEASDATGNRASEEPYEISFEVINEATITNFYPYPNPFSTSCRFVFTLTGSSVPERMKIQIMTISGRVVREIDQTELGPVHIGNNLTEFAWDGTDEFGDELANGVYLYRVIVKQNGENMKNRATFGDKAFKNGFGKLYILR